MSFRKYIITYIITGGVFSSALMAQTSTDPSWLRMDDVKLTEGWLNAENAAGLVRFDGRQISNAFLYVSGESGDMRNCNDAKTFGEFGVKARSYYRLSENVVLNGEISYRNFTGKEMCNSYFIDPGHAPFDLIEYTTENAGEKNLEEYHVKGGVGAWLGKRWAIGASLDYTSANYSKRKDLRHINSLMNMVAGAGVLFAPTELLSFGVNYTYHRRNESLLLSVYGKTDKVYYSLLSYGAFFGKQEVFGENGYTCENETKPLFDEYHGGALQMEWKIAPQLRFFNEVSYRIRNGYYGDHSPSTIVYENHDGDRIAYKGFLVYEKETDTHTLQIDVARNKVSALENIYRYHQESGGLNYIEYLGASKVGERTELSAGLLYTGRYAINKGMPVWQTQMAVSYHSRETFAVNYPDYRRQDIGGWHAGIKGERNILCDHNCYSIGLGIGYGSGSGEVAKDGKYSSTNESSTLTRTLDDLLMQEYEFMTAPQTDVSVSFRYARQLEKISARIYAVLDYQWKKAFDTAYLGNAQRHTVLLRIGCDF